MYLPEDNIAITDWKSLCRYTQLRLTNNDLYLYILYKYQPYKNATGAKLLNEIIVIIRVHTQKKEKKDGKKDKRERALCIYRY